MRKIALYLKTFFMTKSFLFALCVLSVLFSFPFVVSLMSGMFVNLCKEESEKIYGKFDNIIYNVAIEDNLKEIVNIDNVNGYVELYGTIEIYEINEGLVLGAVDKNAIELGNIHIVRGEFPENNTEICMCESLYYELYADCDIGSTILICNQKYKIVGLINDYSAVWNKPVQYSDYVCPNIITSERVNKSDCRKIMLLKNKTAFPREIYKDQTDIVSNTNVVDGNLGAKYKAPNFIYMTLYSVVFIILIYVFSLVSKRDNRNIKILNALGISKSTLKRFTVYKYLGLSLFSVLCGRIIGELFIHEFIKIYNYRNITQVSYPNDINCTNELVFCLLISVITVFLIFKTNNKNKEITSRIFDKIANHNSKNVLWLELIRDYKGIMVSSVVMSIMLVTFLIMGLYLKMYIAAKGDVFGKMPVDYDYQFTTNLNIEDYSYTDSNGEIVSVFSLPNEESVYYMPSHSNIINKSIIHKMLDEPGIYNVENYVEANDIYLNLANKKVNFEYLSGYPVDRVIDEQVKGIFGLDKNSLYRNTQFCSLPKDKILSLEKYVIEGEVDYQKIDAGDEVILVVPIYEKIDYGDGSWGLNYIEYDDYSCKNNQYKDDTFHVGDEIELMQILSDDNKMIGYLNITQVKKNTNLKKQNVRIGAIIYERVMWFEDASQMPTAYSFIGTEKTLYNIGFEPTYSRTQLYLKKDINYRNFEPIINKYKIILESFNYKNNAAEMEEYRQFMHFLKGICYLMMELTMFMMIIIVYTETYTSFLGRREHYSMLRVIGMPPMVYVEIFLRKILVVFSFATLMFLLGGLYMVNSIFGSIYVIWDYLGIKTIAYEMFISLAVLVIITIIIYKPLLKKYVVNQYV